MIIMMSFCSAIVNGDHVKKEKKKQVDLGSAKWE
jgi:hypothetical protein